MTYCVGILLKDGIVLASDSRTHAGVDNFAQFCKMSVFEREGERAIVLLSSGNLAGTQAVITTLKQRGEIKDKDDVPNVWTARTMFDFVTLVAEAVRDDGSARGYPERLRAAVGGDLLEAASLHERFYAPGFAARMVRFAGRSRAVRDVLGDLVLGTQGYVGLKRRLLRAAPRFAAQYAAAVASGGAWRW